MLLHLTTHNSFQFLSRFSHQSRQKLTSMLNRQYLLGGQLEGTIYKNLIARIIQYKNVLDIANCPK